MADETGIRKPRTARLLRILLEDFGLKTWEKFRDEILLEIPKAQNEKRETLEFGLNGSTKVEVESILEALPEFFTADGPYFRESFLPEWGQEVSKKTLNYKDIAPDTFEKLKKQASQASNPRELEHLIETVEEILKGGEAGEPTDEDAVRKALLFTLDPGKSWAISLRGIQSDLDEILGTYEDAVELLIPDSTKKSLQTAEEEVKADLEAQVSKTHDEAVKKLSEALEAVFQENWEREWANNEQAELFIDVLRETVQLSAQEMVNRLVDGYIEYLERSDNPRNPVLATNKVEQFITDFLREVEPALELLKKRRDELQKEYQVNLEKSLAAIFAPASVAGPETGGGLAEEEKPDQEEVPPTDKTAVAEAAIQQLTTHFTAVRGIDPVTLPTVIGKIVGVTVGTEFAVDPDITQVDDLEFALSQLINERVAHEDETPKTLKEKLDALLTAIRAADAEFLEAAAVEKPAVAAPAVGEIATELPAEKVLSDDERRKSVGELMEAQQLMVRQGLEELRLSLKEAKGPNGKRAFTDQQIEEIVTRNRDTLSQQIWLEFLQKGGLQGGDFSFTKMAGIWSGVVKQTTQRILIEQGNQTSPLLQAAAMAGVSENQVARLQKLLRESKFSEADIENAFAHLNKDTFEQLAEFSNKSTSLTREQRIATIKSILQGRKFAETDAGLAATLIGDNNFFGLLEHQLKKQPPILSLNDQRKLEGLIKKTDLGAKDQQELARLLSLLLAQFPPEAFYHLGTNEIAQVHEFLARQQKALEIIGQQLANYPKSGFTNPYAGSTLKRTAQITPEAAADHARDTLMLEITLSMAFQGQQDVNIALVMQEFYADPRMGMVLLASRLGEEASADGGQAGGGLTPELSSQLVAGQRAQFANLAGRQQAGVAAQQQQEAAQKAALLRAVLSSGGNPALLAKNLLTDPMAQDALMAEFEKHKFEILAAMAVPATPMLALLGLIQNVIQVVNNVISGIGSFLSGAVEGISGFLSGATGGSIAGMTGVAATGFETGANVASTGQILVSQAVPATQSAATSTILNTFNGFNALLTGTTTAVTPLIAIVGAIFGPMAFAIIMTFIVFNVIGASLNGTTTEIGLGTEFGGGIPGIGRSGCWPIDGEISALETYPSGRDHDVNITPKGTAVDIGAPIGTPIYSPYSGTARAIRVPCSSSSLCLYGFYVDLRTTDNLLFRFAHMSQFKPGVSVGTTFSVQAGDIIGFVGTTGATGNSYDPHLHYEAIGVNLYALLPVPRNQIGYGYQTSTSECAKGASNAVVPASSTITGPQ